MLSPKSNIFLKEILSYVKFTFDRETIRIELENHIADKMEYYMELGYEIERAEQMSINDMGDAKEIGLELNKQHNPIIGWLWKFTNKIAIIVIVIFFYFFLFFIDLFVPRNSIQPIPDADIVYSIDVNEKVKIDNRVIRFTKIIYSKNNNMNIYYETYNTGIRRTVWSLGLVGEITDNFGNKYYTRSGQETNGLITKGVWYFDDFSKDATMLIISYNMYNRKFVVEIPLEEGEKNE